MNESTRFLAALFSIALLIAFSTSAARSAESEPVPAQDIRLDELDFRDAPLRDALSLIGQAAGLNLAASDEAAKAKVTIHLHNIGPLGAVQAICQTHGLFFNKRPAEDGIGVITTVKEFQEGLTVFREEKTEVYTLLYPNAVDLATSIQDLFGSRVRLRLNTDDGSDEISQRFSRFDVFDGRNQGLGVGGTGTGSNGGTNGNNGNGNNNNNSNGRSSSGGNNRNTYQQPIANTTQRQDDQRDLKRSELEYLAGLIENNKKGNGVDAQNLAALGRNDTSVIYVSVLNRTNQVIVRTSDQAVLDEIDKLKGKIDVPTPQVLLEMKVMSVDLSGGFNSVFDAQFGDQHNSAGFSTGDILPPPLPTATTTIGTGLPATQIPLTIGGNSAASGPPFALNPSSLIYQYVNDNFRFRMQMLNTSNRVTTLATPLLLVANNEVSRVFVGQNRPIVTNISSQTTATQGVITNAPQTTITFQPVGTTLLVTPTINADRTVTLRLVQETSSVISGGATIPIVASNGAVTNQPVDVVTAQTVSGTLVAKDGLSLALGGLVEEGVNDTRQGLPVLGNLPGLGILFRRQVTGRFRREIIIVVRPYILSTPSEAEQVGKSLVDANSIHPKAPEITPAPGEPIGEMNTFAPSEVLRPNLPRNKLEEIFRFHSVLPADY